MKRPRILVTRPLVGDWYAILDRLGDVDLIAGPEGPSTEQLRASITTADALVCLLTDRIDASIIEAGHHLRVIGNSAAGVDNIDLAAARARNVPVCHTPGVLTDATADFTLALLLAVARRLHEGEALLRAGRFTGWRLDMLLGLELRGARLGILGMGRIGLAVAQRARAFGMEVVYWSRRPHPDADAFAERLALEDVLFTSDVVSLHLPLDPDTRGVLDATRLAAMKRGAILINTARGALVDEAELARALREGRLAGAGLDVYAHEPAIHPDLLAAPNAVLQPHLGSATWATRRAMAEGVCADVARVLEGKPPLHVVPT